MIVSYGLEVIVSDQGYWALMICKRSHTSRSGLPETRGLSECMVLCRGWFKVFRMA